jgi:hypothetical protein
MLPILVAAGISALFGGFVVSSFVDTVSLAEGITIGFFIGGLAFYVYTKTKAA